MSSDSAHDDNRSSSDFEVSDMLLGDTGGDDLERLAAKVPPVNTLLLGPPLARSLTFDIGVRFNGGDGGKVSPQSLLSCRPHSDAVLYSSSDEKITDLEEDNVPSKLKRGHTQCYIFHVNVWGWILRIVNVINTYEGLTAMLSSVSPAALRIADTQLVRIPDVIADKMTFLSSQDCANHV